MENKIKVNEYARDDFGNLFVVIGKYERGQFGEICVQLGDFKTKEFAGEQWERHLKIGKLIDLIQCGDYVNGILVTGKESTLLWTEIKGIDRSGYHIPISQYGENIKSVVTKEMMESISYKVTKM